MLCRNETDPPATTARRSSLAIYLPLFAPFSRDIARFRRQSYQDRPIDLIAAVMNEGGVKAWYESHRDPSDAAQHIDRLENVRKLYRIAKETDDPGQDRATPWQNFSS